MPMPTPSVCSASPRKRSVSGPARALARLKPVSSAGSISPCTTRRTPARGLMACTASRTACTCSALARSLLVMSTRSASAICRAGSAWPASCVAAFTASTSVTSPSSRKCAAISVSLASVCTTGAGSARPVVSMITRSKSGISPTLRRAKRSRSVSCRSVRTEQQMQPLASSAMFSDDIVTRSWSMPTSPSSLMTTAAPAIAGWRSRRASKVVLPLPRKPVSSVTGRRPASGSRPGLGSVMASTMGPVSESTAFRSSSPGCTARR